MQIERIASFLPLATSRLSDLALPLRNRGIRRRPGIASAAFQLLTESSIAPLDRVDPRTIDPWRPMPHVLLMTARQPGDPVAVLVFMKSDDLASHARGLQNAVREAGHPALFHSYTWAARHRTSGFSMSERCRRGNPVPGTHAATHKNLFLECAAMIPTRRDLKFHLPLEAASHWHREGAVLTHFINAMSLTFPEGERFFIHTVRHYRDRIEDPVLHDAVTAFVGQEAMHGREHAEYNSLLSEVGLPASEIEAEVAAFFKALKAWLPPAAQLSITIAQEHFTAIVAEALLRDPGLIAGANPRLAALWRWHALEEIEHKAVAFDVYETSVGRSLPAYALRTTSMLTTTAGFLLLVLWCQGRMMIADRRPGARKGVRSFLKVLLSPRSGLVRRVARPWLEYFKPGFHPWDHDNGELLEEMERLVALLNGEADDASTMEPLRAAA